MFTAGDVADYRRAVKAVLADPGRYRGAYDDEWLAEWTWERQAEVLLGAYEEAMGGDRALGPDVVRQDALVAGTV